MTRSRIFSFILLHIFHASNCLQRSDWTYDRETKIANVITNGTTHSCRPYDIIAPIVIRYFNSLRGPCLYGEQSEDDPACVSRSEYIRNLNASLTNPCHVSTPTAEETLDRIEKVYRSASLNDNPATQKWYDRVLRNLTRLEKDCRMDETRLLQPGKVHMIRESALAVFTVGRTHLPRLRHNVSDTQVVLEEARKRAADPRIRLSATFHDERFYRELLLMTELNAVVDSSQDEFTLYWLELAKRRIEFVDKMSLNHRIEPTVTAATQDVVKIRMDILKMMTTANEMLAYIEYTVKDIATSMKFVCPSRDDYELIDE